MKQINKLKRVLLVFLAISIILLSSAVVSAATIKGSIYNSELDLEKDALIEINSTPQQKMLSKDGSYSFEIPVGEYTITATKGFLDTEEKVQIVGEGSFVYDIFLLPGYSDEDDLWKETETNLLGNEVDEPNNSWWRYLVAAALGVFALWRVVKIRKKYGSLRKFRKEVKAEQNKSVEQHQEDIANEPGYLEKVLEIIKKNDGRITQKDLRKEMLHLSEAKISLIITELEHKGKVEKIKKGRGNVIILKKEENRSGSDGTGN